ncbi:indoleamine 2,3-dioxygenase family protein [Annulohypoxylon maeteangense]|uniref:indoleamine 2,3-dioxygenase family protein n=1 Tax=Annulohypoxylon maeteangense TaxID=1927788 RepID=UPI0020083043|nr:indoleamine 2,3-dioxygenase family protein [Annulohypoxylon maeteangense]KAI0888697.1 indoleamine 2,3-dioxygenase family protein [Annulohypoxylon maeteangense]
MLIPKSSFEVLEDTKPNDVSLPAFMVSTSRGFLARMNPIVVLPPEFEVVEKLLQAMPVLTLSGEPGLLANGQLGDTVLQDLPDLTDEVEKYRDNLPIMNALYRDYSFLASAFLLEPCHMRFIKGEPYGLGRSFLPAQLSRPIVRCAELAGFKPFMEYAGSYALFNYRLQDPEAGLEYSNLRLIRAFEHGLDPTSSEAGFVLVHIDMVKNSGPLVHGTMAALKALENADGLSPRQQRQAFNEGMRSVVGAMQKVNNVMETMWMKSKPRSYTSFRTFIFGITSQSMFPDGVVYEGINEGKPMSFRGESGANDTMIPLMDNLLQVQMPDTPLTEILKDFRDYRPSNHRQFLGEVKKCSEDLGVKDFALSIDVERTSSLEAEDLESVKESRRLWLQALNQVRDFRWRHWCFAREYILKQTSHPTATGGSPIVTWLPNQLQAVMEEMKEISDSVGALNGSTDLGAGCRDIMDLVERQSQTLNKEVEKYCLERGVGVN